MSIEFAGQLGQRALPEPFSGVSSITRHAERQAWAAGHAIKALELPNTVDTRFQMASGCKIFTPWPSAN